MAGHDVWAYVSAPCRYVKAPNQQIGIHPCHSNPAFFSGTAMPDLCCMDLPHTALVPGCCRETRSIRLIWRVLRWLRHTVTVHVSSQSHDERLPHFLLVLLLHYAHAIADLGGGGRSYNMHQLTRRRSASLALELTSRRRRADHLGNGTKVLCGDVEAEREKQQNLVCFGGPNKPRNWRVWRHGGGEVGGVQRTKR